MLDAKRAGTELDRGPRIPSISNFLDQQLDRLSAEDLAPAPTRDPARLDALFQEVLEEVNGSRL